MNPCKVCSVICENMQKCSACKSVHYCSADCQRKDWKFHKTACFKVNQVYFSDKAIETVFNNQVFNKMFQYIHDVNITGTNIKDKLMLCLISPNFSELKKLESYSCIINIVPITQFSEEIKSKLNDKQKSVYFVYFDESNYDMNSSKGSIINFDFEYEKRDMICYEAIKELELPAMITVYLDGRCE